MALGLIVLGVLAAGPRLGPPAPQTTSVEAVKARAIARPAGDLTALAGAPNSVAQPKLKLNVLKVAASSRAPKMARKATLNLIVTDVGGAISSVEALARAFDGDVTRLDDQRPASPDERHEANLTLVVPAQRFDMLSERLANLGGVRSQSAWADDVADQLVDGEARLRNLHRTEGDMLKIMDRAGRVGEILAVENQLSDVREQIEKLDAETQALKARVATSTIDVHLEEEVRMVGAEPNAASRLGDAWAAAWHASRDAAFALIARLFILIAFAPYWLTLLAIGAFLVAYARRRLRSQSA